MLQKSRWLCIFLLLLGVVLFGVYGCNHDDDDPPPIVEPQEPDPVTEPATSADGGIVVQESSGAKITIPQGAVPQQQDGASGTLIFSIERAVGVQPQLPPDHTFEGSVYRLGPSGVTFATPVAVTLPTRGNLQPDEYIEIFRMDEQTGELTPLGATYDPDTNTVTGFTDRFSFFLTSRSKGTRMYLTVNNNQAPFRHVKGVYFGRIPDNGQVTFPAAPPFTTGITVGAFGAGGAIGDLPRVANVGLTPGRYMVCVEGWAPPAHHPDLLDTGLTASNWRLGTIILPDQYGLGASRDIYVDHLSWKMYDHDEGVPQQGFDSDVLCNKRTVTPTAPSETKNFELTACNIPLKKTGSVGITIHDWDVSSIPAGASIDFKFNAKTIPDRFVVDYAGSNRLNTGFRGDSSKYDGDSDYPGGVTSPGQGEALNLFQVISGVDSFRVTVYGRHKDTLWDYWVSCNH